MFAFGCWQSLCLLSGEITGVCHFFWLWVCSKQRNRLGVRMSSG